MTSKIEGISAETVEAVSQSIRSQLVSVFPSNGTSDAFEGRALNSTISAWMDIAAQAAITALLASGEVVLRKDVEEFKVKAEMLDMIEHECWDLRCVTTAEDDYCWQVVGHWQASPSERILSGGSTVIKAMKEAMLPRDYDGSLIDALAKFTTRQQHSIDFCEKHQCVHMSDQERECKSAKQESK